MTTIDASAPDPLPLPKLPGSARPRRGWSFVSWTDGQRLFETETTSFNHWIVVNGKTESGSQREAVQYASRKDAALAAYWERCRGCAQQEFTREIADICPRCKTNVVPPGLRFCGAACSARSEIK